MHILPRKLSSVSRKKIKDVLRDVSPKDYTIAELAKRFHVSERMIYYYKDELSEKGELYSQWKKISQYKSAIKSRVPTESNPQYKGHREEFSGPKHFPSGDEIDTIIEQKIQGRIKSVTKVKDAQVSQLRDEMVNMRKVMEENKRQKEHDNFWEELRRGKRKTHLEAIRQPKSMMDRYYELMMIKSLSTSSNSGLGISQKELFSYAMLFQMMDPPP